MKLIFGLELDDEVLPRPTTEGGVWVVGTKKLLHLLEAWLGLAVPRERIEHIRTEQFRQLLEKYLLNKRLDNYHQPTPPPFFARSFEADKLACAEMLLQRRDELLLAGWDFALCENMPERLRTFAELERLFRKEKHRLEMGMADRFVACMARLETAQLPLEEVAIVEPLTLLPPQYRRLFKVLEAKNILIRQLDAPHIEAIGETDLEIFKLFIAKNSNHTVIDFSNFNFKNSQFKNDGSLRILAARRETDLAAWFAKFLAKNRRFRPALLLPERTRILDNAMILEGLPSLGLLLASPARPTLQILKLVTAFIWRPIDPYKILEFVTLASKPLADDLARIIATLVAHRPGLHGEQWRYEIDNYFKNLEILAQEDASINTTNIRKEYEFWFSRNTYDSQKSAPTEEIIEIFRYLNNWASSEFERTDSKNASLMVLAEQARRIAEFLDSVAPFERFLTALELERIIRMIYEPAPVQPRLQEVGALDCVARQTALLGDVEALVWWNFVDTEGGYFFSRWYGHETNFLKAQNIDLQTPQQENALMLWQREQPILRTQQQLWLMTPHRTNGKDNREHPLLSYFRACFGDKALEEATICTDELKANYSLLFNGFYLPKNINLSIWKGIQVRPFIELGNEIGLAEREHETLSSLETLFYYPHEWVFSHKAKLYASPILSIVNDNALMGNLAHRFFEVILSKEDFYTWSRAQMESEIERLERKLLQQEGAVLLLYGRETDRIRFMNTLKTAIWSLVQHICHNDWQVERMEKPLEGTFSGKEVKGRADLVLRRGEELAVVDLKWGGKLHREEQIKNREDLQLTLYSHLLTDDENVAHTAYYIIEKAAVVARNTLAFNGIAAIAPELDNFEVQREIWKRMIKTYQWRMEQIQAGKIEVRSERTIPLLNAEYEGQNLLDMLELPKKGSAYDIYKTLITGI